MDRKNSYFETWQRNTIWILRSLAFRLPLRVLLVPQARELLALPEDLDNLQLWVALQRSVRRHPPLLEHQAVDSVVLLPRLVRASGPPRGRVLLAVKALEHWHIRQRQLDLDHTVPRQQLRLVAAMRAPLELPGGKVLDPSDR